MRYYLIAGEASGDLHGANLMQAIKLVDRQAEFRFWGGDLMAAQGGEPVRHYREMAFMGFIPVLKNLTTILKNMDLCRKDIATFAPDVVILIDYPGFNLKIAKYVKTKLHIRTIYYISPKVWAWKESRIKDFRRYVDDMLCIFPFEVDFFKRHDYAVSYVGNPSVEAVCAFRRENQGDSFEAFCADHSLLNRPVIAVLAGSRLQEIADNLPSMLQAVAPFGEKYQVVIAGAPSVEAGYYAKYIEGREGIAVVHGQTFRLLSYAKVALVTSGTATLETALLGVPQVVCYRTPLGCLVRLLFKYFLKVPYISLVNLVADKEVVKELFADKFSVQNIYLELDKILSDEDYRTQMEREYVEVKNILGDEGASMRAAKYIYGVLY